MKVEGEPYCPTSITLEGPTELSMLKEALIEYIATRHGLAGKMTPARLAQLNAAVDVLLVFGRFERTL